WSRPSWYGTGMSSLNPQSVATVFTSLEERRSYDSGERSLLAATLADALLNLTEPNAKYRSSRDRFELLRWLASDSVHCCPEQGISFAFICEELGLDPQFIRSCVQRGTVSPSGLVVVKYSSSRSVE